MLRPPLTLRDLTSLRPPLLCVEWFDNRNLHIATAAGIYVLDIETGTQERLLDRETVVRYFLFLYLFGENYCLFHGIVLIKGQYDWTTLTS